MHGKGKGLSLEKKNKTSMFYNGSSMGQKFAENVPFPFKFSKLFWFLNQRINASVRQSNPDMQID